MSEPFLAEIKIIGFNFAPRGWAYCDGQILPINQNQSLYSLLGTTYGGDGRTNFALPDLRSRTPIHKGNGYDLGQKGGMETVTLSAAEMASHTHAVRAADTPANIALPENSLLGAGGPIYEPPATATRTPLRPGTIANVGGGQPHNNMQPYGTLGFVIAMQGLFPSRG